jgi:hypothetical protein
MQACSDLVRHGDRAPFQQQVDIAAGEALKIEQQLEREQREGRRSIACASLQSERDHGERMPPVVRVVAPTRAFRLGGRKRFGAKGLYPCSVGMPGRTRRCCSACADHRRPQR